jgi:hypothetical protein
MVPGDGPRFYDDDGTEFNPDPIPVPDLCATCARNGKSARENVVCALNRADQMDEDVFVCFAYAPISPAVDREAVLRDLCARAGVPYDKNAGAGEGGEDDVITF